MRYSQSGDAIQAKISAFITDSSTMASMIQKRARGLSGFTGSSIGDERPVRITLWGEA